jgi:hypothetical protein
MIEAVQANASKKKDEKGGDFYGLKHKFGLSRQQGSGSKDIFKISVDYQDFD